MIFIEDKIYSIFVWFAVCLIYFCFQSEKKETDERKKERKADRQTDRKKRKKKRNPFSFSDQSVNTQSQINAVNIISYSS